MNNISIIIHYYFSGDPFNKKDWWSWSEEGILNAMQMMPLLLAQITINEFFYTQHPIAMNVIHQNLQKIEVS